jgi:hypothetical protein
MAARFPSFLALALGIGVGAIASASGAVHVAVPAVEAVPFELYGNHIFLQVAVADSGPLTFLLDTGSSASVVSRARAEPLHLPLAQDIPARGVGEGRATVTWTGRALFAVGASRFQAQRVVAFDVGGIEAATGRHIDGVLGVDFFRQFVVEIDPVSKMLRLHAPGRFVPDRRAERISLRVSNGLAFLPAEIRLSDRKTVSGEFLVDTGQARPVSLNKPFVDANKLLDAVRTAPTFTAGMGGEYRSVFGRLAGFKVGPFALTLPPADFSQASGGGTISPRYAGRLGMGILMRFRLALDYANARLHLEPLSTLAAPFDEDASGAILSSDRLRALKVLRVIDGTAADAAGLAPGDLIRSVNDRPVGSEDLEQVREWFRKPGLTYRLGVERPDGEIEVTLLTRKRI